MQPGMQVKGRKHIYTWRKIVFERLALVVPTSPMLFRTRVVSFLAGLGAAGAFAIVQLRQDVWESHKILSQQVRAQLERWLWGSACQDSTLRHTCPLLLQWLWAGGSRVFLCTDRFRLQLEIYLNRPKGKLVWDLSSN